jgi:hypothetical protein
MSDDAVLGTPVPSPSAVITVRRVRAINGVIVTVRGTVGRNDAAVLSGCLHRELDDVELDGVRLPRQRARVDAVRGAAADENCAGMADGDPSAASSAVDRAGQASIRLENRSPDHGVAAVPSVVVVDLGDVELCDPAAFEVLVVARERARSQDIGFHILDRGNPTMHRLLGKAGLIAVTATAALPTRPAAWRRGHRPSSTSQTRKRLRAPSGPTTQEGVR